MKIEVPPKKTPIALHHPNHYLMHKYWARKPHNVINDLIQFFTKEGEIVLDPFVGSGVTVIESIKLNRKAIGVDINPISFHIIEGTCNQIPVREFDLQVEEIAKEIIPLVESLYGIECEKCAKTAIIGHTVWTQVITCDNCKSEFPIIEAKKKGRQYLCTKCHAPNRTFHTVKRNEIPYSIWYNCSNCGHKSRRSLQKNEIKEIIRIQNKSKNNSIHDEMIPNPRTLAEDNMHVSDLFTARNLLIISAIVNLIHKIPDNKLRNTMMFIFTSSLAQSSRLIAYRGGLSTGGPAWTVSGFWIPPINLEINPLNNFITKASKIKSGKKELSNDETLLGFQNFRMAKTIHDFSHNSNALILNQSINSISEKEIPTELVDYIFADPPYGDSVPYLEYSIIWSSWLHKKLDFTNEIIISNSPIRDKNATDYKLLLSKAFQNCYRMLKNDHWMTITFHNRSLETWYILLNSIREAGFKYVSASYLIPAVISAKAQLSKEGSPAGDILMHFRKSNSSHYGMRQNYEFSEIQKFIIKRVNDLLLFMGGKAPSNHVLNAVLFLLLEYDHTHISYVELKPLLLQNFMYEKGYWVLKSKPEKEPKNNFRNLLKKIIEDNKNDLNEHELIAKVYDSLEIWQIPTMSEIRDEVRKLIEQHLVSNSSLDNFL